MLMLDNESASGRPRDTIVILSRGARLGAMYREVARDLARDFRVVALMLDATEHEIWRDADDIVCIDLAAEIAREVDKYRSNLAERTKDIEQETNLPLYRAASNYLLYRRFAKEYLGAWPPFYDTEQHMMEEYVGSHGALSRVLDEYRPVLVIYEALDLVTTLMAMTLAFRRGIFSCGCILAPGMKDGTVIFYHGLRRQNFICSYLMRHPDLITAESVLQARAIIAKGREDGLPPVTHVEWRRSRLIHPWHFAADLLRWGGLRNPRLLFERISNWLWLDRHCSRKLPQSPFILFLMHLQPEASTTSQAPRWVDQGRVVEQMAINAPRGIRIVVKENPQCFGWRGKRYFGALADLANVELCHPLVSTRELIQRAQALVAITGSGGFEAMLHGTRVAVLGRPFYSEFPGVRLLDSPEQIFDELADPTWRPETYEADFETFVAAYVQSVHSLGDVAPGRKWPAPKTVGPNFGAAVRKLLSFIEQHGLKPQDFDPGYPIAGPDASASAAASRSVNYA